jgi:phosphatidylglycerol lysyltransferase
MHIPLRELWWLAAGGAGYGARYVKLRWHSVTTASRVLFTDEDPTPELLRLQNLHGYNAHALVSIMPGAKTWSTPAIDGAIIYSEFGRVWLAVGDPLAADAEVKELARRFVAAARKKRRIPAFVPATARFALEAVESGLVAVKIGAAPYFDLQKWAPRGDHAKKVRSGVNQARRAGVRVEAIETAGAEIRKETETLCQSWLKSRRAATRFGWLFVLDPFQHAEQKRFFAARDESGLLVGFLAASPMPARDGWYLEDVLRQPDAPAGTADLLVVEALTRLAADGAKCATLGTSPLAREGEQVVVCGHRLIESMVQKVSRRLERFYNFEGLRRFKAKFVPTWWESEYVLVPRGMAVPPLVTYAIIRAIVPGGIAQLITRQVARTLKVKRKKTKTKEGRRGTKAQRKHEN